jgi:ElaB/YqjD/DUF883 family membrane-anchored ribosome-binding protein
MTEFFTEKTTKTNGTAFDFHNKAQGGENHLEQLAHEAGEKIGSVVSNIAASASDYANHASGYVKSGRTYVQNNPATGIVLAALTGVVLGGLLAMTLGRRS